MPLPDTWPAGGAYDEVPDLLREVLRRSYRERDAQNLNLADGFLPVPGPTPQDEQPFQEVLDRLVAHKAWKVLLEVYNRCKHKVPKLWESVRWVNTFYDFTSSRGVWVCYQPDKIVAAHRLLKGSENFCGDMSVGHSTHQKIESGAPLPSQCYRELGVVGDKGLHVCLTVPGLKKSAFGEWQNIHIDPHQIGSEKTARCGCWYAKTSKHMADVGLWCCEYLFKAHGTKPSFRALMLTLGVSDAAGLHGVMMPAVGDYDRFVDMADDPARYKAGADLKTRARVETAVLFKQAYMETVGPEHDI
ncbi:MAG: hypothetical protein ACRC33_16790 [Gemmataceae bacterium]